MIPDVIPISSNTRWPRGQRYSISVATDSAYPQMREERIVPVGGRRATWYDPAATPEILARLLEVATGLTNPIEFADEYGLLGYANLHRWDGIPPAEMGDFPVTLLPVEELKVASQRIPEYMELETGEPIYWFEAHVRTVKVAHDLIAHLKLKDERRLRDLLEAFPKASYAALDGMSDVGAFSWATDYAAHDVMVATREAIIGLINPNIQGLQRQLHVDSLGRLRTSLTFTALIQVIYWHLAARLDSDKLLPRYCELCGEPFFAGDPRQRYCPKPLGKSRSVCGARAVKEQFKQRWPNGKSQSSSKHKRRRNRRPASKKKLQ